MRVSHSHLLETALLEYSNAEPDITVSCSDGKLISTSKFLLAFYSQFLQNILQSVQSHNSISLCLPVSSGSVIYLLNILATGEAVSSDTHDLVEVNNAAKILGIPFSGWELASRSSKNNVKKEILEKDEKIVTEKEQTIKSEFNN